MAVLFSWEGGDAALWREEMSKYLPGLDLRVFPYTGDPDNIEYAMVWMHPPGDLKRYRNLKAIFSIGAGVSHILRDQELPESTPIVRLVDEVLSLDMATHAVHWVIHFHRGYHCHLRNQAAKVWRREPYPENHERRIGILGLGEIGRHVVTRLRGLSFAVSGWSRTAKAVEGVRSFHGFDQLAEFLGQTDILVCILPPTPATTDLLDASRLSQLPQGASLINIGRGEIIVDADLIAALDTGRLSGAALDVFRTEPLPSSSPFWSHPKVYVTPHAAGPTNQRSGARATAQNILRIERGQKPYPIVDRAQGY